MLLFFLIAGIAVIVPVTYHFIGEWQDRRRYPAPGRIVNGLHILQSGAIGPTVILEAGIAGTSLSWKPVQDLVSQFATAYSYDRAGLGWSAAPAAPRTLDNIVAELRSLKLPGPYILVGHSFGGLVVQHYAALYPDDVQALVLVDPVPVKDWFPLTAHQAARLHRGVKLSRRGALLARIGVVRLALQLLMSGSRTLPKLMARAAAGNGASVTDRLTGEVRKLPREVWPAVRAHWCLPKSFRAMADYLDALPANAATAKLPIGIPTLVLTPVDFHCEIPSGAEHRIVRNTGHWIQLDAPEQVAQAIREMQTML